MLFVLEDAERINPKRPRYKCLCDCGNYSIVEGRHLRDGKIKSCGCLAKKRIGDFSRTHGMTNSPEYKTWSGIKRRCLNKNDARYHHYGGRGILICERWKNSFEAFLYDMGEKPHGNYSIERIDFNGHYEPTNCKWIKNEVQQKNKRSNVILSSSGKTMILSDWAKETGLSASTISARLRYGWSVDDALSKPLSYPKKCHAES